MIGRSPPATKKAEPNLKKAMSINDLSPNATISIVETIKNVQHSPKRHNVNVRNIALPAKNVLKNELKINVNELSDMNNYDKENKSASSILTINNDVGQLIQTGIDRYITVQPKRKRSPRSAASSSMSKFTKLASVELTHGNRFSSLIDINDDVQVPSTENKVKNEKPPPIYLREASTADLLKTIEHLTEGNFYISGVKKGNIKETKIQPLNIDAYRALISHFEHVGKHFYTYQLKSQKGMVVILKGIESYVAPEDIITALANKGFHAKSVTNIINREKVPQPLFRLELVPDNKKTRGQHQIFDLKYLLHRRITIEVPKKRTGPIQCLKCQEFGHTQAYCTLNDVCVICGELHNSKECDKKKTDASVKKCSNCDGNHTANYRGCPVYIELKRRINPRQRAEQRMLKLHPSTNKAQQPEIAYRNIQKGNLNATVNSNIHQGISFADILKAPAPKIQVSEEANISTALNKLTNMMQSFMTMMERTMDLMMQNMNMLMQIVVKNQK